MNGRKDRLTDMVQSVLVFVLLLLLLFTSGISVNYMMKYVSSEAELDMIREEGKKMMTSLEIEIKDGVERRLVIIEGKVYTIEKRVDHIEERAYGPLENIKFEK